ncbi:MAG: glycoside hydrolase family 2 TIM barrel-domain containing protein, partial [Daejeonella sp.]
NDDIKSVSLQGEVVLTDEKGFQKTLPFTAGVEAGKTAQVIVRTKLTNKQVHLWSCDDPYLYKSKASIENGSGFLHENNERFGLRMIEVDNKKYTFKLNGIPMRIMGFNLVPDDRTTGNTLPLWRIKEDIDLMKSMGANLARLSHLPLPKEMLDYLDEKGIMIFSEIPLWGYDQLVDKNNPIPKEWLKRLVTVQYNHPAIIGWSVGNEIGNVPGSMDYVQSAIQYVKIFDTTRLAVMVSHTADRGVSDPVNYSEIGLVNKYGAGIGMSADKIHSFHPDKLLFYAEYGYGQLEEDLDGDVNAKAMVDSLRFKPYLMGGSLWTFNDYRSAYPGTKEYSENRPWGVVDVFRQKKEAWFSFKKEYAPVREFTVNNFINDKNASATISIKPRLLLDLPAYPLHHYSLVWKVFDVKGIVQKGGFINLPDLKPGDAGRRFPISWQMPVDAFNLQVSLLSPLNYCVADTVIFLQKPSTPKITYAAGVRTQMNYLGNTGNIRLVFEKNVTTPYYKLRYGKNGLTSETLSTRNNYFNISNVVTGDTYQVAVVGINSFGESVPDGIVTVKIGADYPAPLITYTEAADKGFYVGYPVDDDDYLFQLQYTATKGDYSTASTIQTTSKGVMFVPGLQNGQTYYYRMRRWEHNTYISQWSEEIAVTPDGGLMPPKPILSGVLRQGAEAIVCFEPVKKATGYELEYRTIDGSKWKMQMVNAAQINYFKLNGLMPKRSYEFRMTTLNQNGRSEYSQTVRE